MNTTERDAAFRKWLDEAPAGIIGHDTAFNAGAAWGQARAAIAQQPKCRTCVGEGVDGEPGDEPGAGYTWRCQDCNGTGRAAIAQPAEPAPEPVAYLARSRYGSQCHFGMKAAAEAWAGDDGEVFEIPLRHLGLVAPAPAEPAAQADAQPVAPFVATLQQMLNHPGDLPLFWIWEQAAHISDEFNERVRLKQAVEVVGAVLRATAEWAQEHPQLFAAAPPARQPQPLTDEQVMQCFDDAVTDYVDVTDAEMIDFARAIERAHGIGREGE